MPEASKTQLDLKSLRRARNIAIRKGQMDVAESIGEKIIDQVGKNILESAREVVRLTVKNQKE